MPKSPVFVVGSPRSGTSILVDALNNVGYKGYREGNFFTLSSKINKLIDRHFEIFGNPDPSIMVANVDQSSFKEKIEDVFKDVIEGLNTSELWFDKSGNPEMILAIPTLRRLWPNSVYIFAKRRAIENVFSRQKKFPSKTFEFHCDDWTRNMSSWRQIRTGLPNETYVEIDQQDLLQKPKVAADRLTNLLGLSPDLCQKLLDVFGRNRPQQSDDGSASRIHEFKTISWSDEKKEMFLAKCGEEMEAYGYSLSSDYWAS